MSSSSTDGAAARRVGRRRGGLAVAGGRVPVSGRATAHQAGDRRSVAGRVAGAGLAARADAAPGSGAARRTARHRCRRLPSRRLPWF